ncbi:MAG: T9SS type A sorting domain-containing protein [Flavobacteriales bacterium]|nr:T9SS type A sorting domain-containing protein [Flavobacteriales bacterium]
MNKFNLWVALTYLGGSLIPLSGQNGTSLSNLQIPRNPVFYETNHEVERGSISYCNYNQPGNSFEDGRISMHDVYTNVNQSADDFDVPANTCMVLSQVISTHFSFNNPTSMNIYIYEDNAGVPGNLVIDYIGVSFTYLITGSAFGLTARSITCNLPTSLELCGGPTGKKYWISVTSGTGTDSFWEFQTINPYGLSGKFRGVNFGQPNWIDYGDHFVFTLNYQYKSELVDTIKLCGTETVNINGTDYDYATRVDQWLTSTTGCDSIAPVLIIKDYGHAGTYEIGRISMHDVYPNINQCADDFIVPANECISVDGVQANFLVSMGSIINSVIVYFYDDNAGVPGNLLLQDTVLYSYYYVGNWNGMLDINHVQTALSSPINFCGGASGTKYWVSFTVATGSNAYWEFESAGPIIHSPAKFKGPSFGYPNWTTNNENMIFSLNYRYIVSINTPTETTFCANYSPITLTATPAGGTFSGQGISGNQFNPSSASIGLNEIIYTYLASDDCEYTDTLTLNVLGCASLNELPTLNLQAYPNPTDDIFYLSGYSSMNIPFTWHIMNVAGQIISSGNNVLNNGENKISFDLSGLASGTYLLKIQSSDQDQVIRVIKK